MKVIRLLSSLLLLTLSNNAAVAETTPDIATRIDSLRIEYWLNVDGSGFTTSRSEVTVLKERALQEAKRRTISFSTSVQKAEVIEAYTRKADGHRIDVPKNNYQLEENKGRDKNSPVFSDYTTLTVVFPDLAVGDTVVLGYKITQTEPIFPGQFSEVNRFPRIYEYDEVTVRFNYPASMRVQYEAREMTERIEEKEGRRIIEWTYANKQPIKSERRDYSVYDMEQDPGFSISTFHSYAEIAEAYGIRARPKAVVTDRVRKLADEISAGMPTPREQAQALYDWVATNITYAGNCIGVGAVVPHDIDFVLDNRMGDCKDHATLLEALLAAKGIASIQVLVNAGGVYRLPRIPVVSTVNHVINYIPSLDLYADSTASTVPFGMLPLSIYGKPVLWVNGHKDGTSTPVQPIGENRQYMKTVAKVGADGAITGTAEVDLNGLFAVSTRAWMRNIPKDMEEELIKASFQRNGHTGSGTFDKPDPRELRSTYQYKVTFDMKDFLLLPGAGAFAIGPFIFSEAPIGRFVQAAVEPIEQVDVFCSSGVSSEEYQLELPASMKILSLPDNVSIANDFLAYRSSYELKGNILTVTRVFDDKTRGHICSPELSVAYKDFAKKAMADVRAQVVYK